MINQDLLLDRFGDTEFLNELWLKAARELPGRLESVDPEIQAVLTGKDGEVLAKMLHKLRGLVANFLTEKEALAELVASEKSLERGELEQMSHHWTAFKPLLKQEVENLEGWLKGEGF